MSKSSASIKTLGVLLFPRFELLDVCGPLEMFGNLPEKFKIHLIAEKSGPVQSTQGPILMADCDLETAPQLNLLLIPGGLGTREEVNNANLLAWIKTRAKNAELILSVCTGSALLAKAGLLDKHKATSNKLAFNWVVQQGPGVNWVKEARWVEDGNIVTSAGIAAGIDMSLHVIARLYGDELSNALASKTEYIRIKDAAQDPFAINIPKA